MGGMYHYWGMGWSWILGLAVIVVVIWLVVRSTNRNSGYKDVGRSALDILNERYARGEISKEEFAEKKKDIQG